MTRKGDFFNVANLESVGGRPQEFVDPFHPSESAYIRMLLTMLAKAFASGRAGLYSSLGGAAPDALPEDDFS